MEVKTVRLVMSLLAVAYLGTSWVFLFGEPFLSALMGWGADLTHLSNRAFEYDRFYLALSTAMMAMLVYIAVQVAATPQRSANLLPVMVVSKLTSSAVGLVLYMQSPAFGYLLIPLVDLPLAGIGWWVYRLLRRAS